MAFLIRKKVDGSVADRWELGEHDLIVGRGESAHARTPDPEMSRQHFKITCKQQQHYVQDLKSRNGTLVNGKAITEAPLQNNDEIRAGESLFLYSSEGKAEVAQTIKGVHQPKVLK
jgi:pSer/pThr/pTyr-binding forkhead associated (FHA) protein